MDPLADPINLTLVSAGLLLVMYLLGAIGRAPPQPKRGRRSYDR